MILELIVTGIIGFLVAGFYGVGIGMSLVVVITILAALAGAEIGL